MLIRTWKNTVINLSTVCEVMGCGEEDLNLTLKKIVSERKIRLKY